MSMIRADKIHETLQGKLVSGVKLYRPSLWIQLRCGDTCAPSSETSEFSLAGNSALYQASDFIPFLTGFCGFVVS